MEGNVSFLGRWMPRKRAGQSGRAVEGGAEMGVLLIVRCC